MPVAANHGAVRPRVADAPVARALPIDSSDFWRTPQWFFYRFASPRSVEFLYFHTARTFGALPFHFPGCIESRLPANYPRLLLDWDGVVAQAARQTTTCGYLFHMTLGGSSLFCRRLQAIPGTVVIKEAAPLTRFAESVADVESTPGEDRWRQGLLAAHRLYGRTFESSGAAVHKPMHRCNVLLEDLFALDPDCAAIYLYSSPAMFLASILRRPDRRRAVIEEVWAIAKSVTARLSRSKYSSAAWTGGAPPRLSDSAAVATFWAWSILPAVAAAENPEYRNRLRFVESDDLYDRPIEAMNRACVHYGIGMAEEDRPAVERLWIEEGEIHAKDGLSRFDKAAGVERRKNARREFQSEIDAGLLYLESICPLVRVREVLSANRLLADPKETA